MDNGKLMQGNRGNGQARRTTLPPSHQTSPSAPQTEVQTTRKVCSHNTCKAECVEVEADHEADANNMFNVQGGLVDYPDEDSDEDESEESLPNSSPKRARITSS